MTTRNAVIWSEGLFVKPQHFQQQARALEHHTNQRINAASEHLYGFSVLELNHEYLSFGKIVIIRAQGIMPDGTVFNIPNDQAPPAPLAVTDSCAGQVVYLTLPLKSDGVLEVQWPDTYANARYTMKSEEARDTHSQEGDHIHIDLALPNLQLSMERDDRSAFTGIAMCCILDRHPDGSLLLDEKFYPTSVSLSAVPPLGRFLGEATSLMRERARSIAQRTGSPSQSGVADVTDFNLLQALNRLYPLFLHLSRRQHLHPEQLYIAFAQACGELATFTNDGRLPEEHPAYQHDNLRESFRQLEEILRRALSTVLQPRAVSLPIIKQQYGTLTATVHDRRLLDDADFILAVQARMPLEKLRQQFVQQAKVTSQEKLSELINLQLPGIPLTPLPVAPRHLPFHAGFSYFQLDRSHENWKMMHDATGFGFHIAGDYPELEMQFWAIRSQ